MYFDALRTIINSKNQKSDITRSILLQNWSFPPKSGDEPILIHFRPISSLFVIFSFFKYDNRFQRLEIHRLRCINTYISNFDFWLFI